MYVYIYIYIYEYICIYVYIYIYIIEREMYMLLFVSMPQAPHEAHRRRVRAGNNIPRLPHFESLPGSFSQRSSSSSRLVYLRGEPLRSVFRDPILEKLAQPLGDFTFRSALRGENEQWFWDLRPAVKSHLPVSEASAILLRAGP